jgi:hypothetical protein
MKSATRLAFVPFLFFGAACVTGCSSGDAGSAIGQQSSGINSSGSSADDYIQSPVGPVHKSCFHELSEGDVVDEVGNITHADGTQEILADCQYPDPLETKHAAGNTPAASQAPTDNGWTETAYWVAPSDVGLLYSALKVPEEPDTKGGQLIFLFSALEDGSWENIAQPVIQFGPNGNYGGNYWGYASWYGGKYWRGHYYMSPYKKVNPGTIVYGDTFGSASNCKGGCAWTIDTWTDSSDMTSLTVHTTLGWRVVFGGTIEVYGINSCKKYPASASTFSDIIVQEWGGSGNDFGDVSWTPSIDKTTCSERVTSSKKSCSSCAPSVNLFY